MVNCLYIHIPFCIKKCIYCDFYSIPITPHSFSFNRSGHGEIVKDYVNALCKEMELRKGVADNLKTIYIGGGTPSILSAGDILNILNSARKNYFVNTDAEITLEANPRTIDEKKAEKLLAAGINRISIGIQSFIDNELAIIGRSHTVEDAIKAVRDVSNAGVRNISIDLIYGIPFPKFQDSNFKFQIQNWQYSLQKAVELNPEHISAYELTPEKNTSLYRDIEKGRLVMPNDEVIAEMYYETVDILKKHGYLHYEISNFSKPGYQSIHNLNYWDMGEYVGIGAGAHSFFNRKRTNNVRDAAQYIESIDKGRIPVAEEVEIKGDDVINEYIFLGLRKTEGIDILQIPLSKEGRKEIIKAIDKAVKELASHGLVEMKGSYLKLTRRGLLFCSEVIVKILLCIEKSLP